MNSKIAFLLVLILLIILMLFYYIDLESNIIILLGVVIVLIVHNIIKKKEHFSYDTKTLETKMDTIIAIMKALKTKEQQTAEGASLPGGKGLEFTSSCPFNETLDIQKVNPSTENNSSTTRYLRDLSSELDNINPERLEQLSRLTGTRP